MREYPAAGLQGPKEWRRIGGRLSIEDRFFAMASRRVSFQKAGGIALLAAAATGLTISAPKLNAATAEPAGITSAASPVAPAVTLALSPSSVTTLGTLTVKVKVSGGSGKATPTGTVKLASGSYRSAAAALKSGSATIAVIGKTLGAGTHTLTATYTPDAHSLAVYKAATGTHAVTVAKVVPMVKVTPSAASISHVQELTVTVVVATQNEGVPAGSVVITSGSYASAAAPLASGKAVMHVPGDALAVAKDTLKATFTPTPANGAIYASATGKASVTVSASAKVTPTVTVLPSAAAISTAQALTVTIAVSGAKGDVTPTGAVTLTIGLESWPSVALSNGSVKIPVGTLAAGSATLNASYKPSQPSNAVYNTATGTATVTVAQSTTVSVDQTSTGPKVTDQILGMNMAVWYDVTANAAAIKSGFQTAGIKAVRWPGGSESDGYSWQTNAMCANQGYADPDDTFANFVSDVVAPTGVDVALTANYGSNTNCNGPGEPSEAAAWINNAQAIGANVSHMTVGNEEYGSWEYDLHSSQHDPTTYAGAVAGTNGFYNSIKAANKNVLVGVDVDADGESSGWDATVMSQAKGYYDFVELHFYPQGPGNENDTYIVQQGAQDLTNSINVVKQELLSAGNSGVPIYLGEMGSVYTNPGKQSTSITQALFAGQVLGELMNDGISRATWWIGFGGCEEEVAGDPDPSGGPNFSSSLYGWQNFGGYMVFSDGLPEYGCEDETLPAGVLLPTARAYQLFSNVAVTGETVLSATVNGDATDVRAYAATHEGGTALVLFNDNETTTQAVELTLSGATKSSDVTRMTYSKAIYDESKSGVWAPPVTKDLGAQTLPLTLMLDPWSMNVVLIK